MESDNTQVKYQQWSSIRQSLKMLKSNMLLEREE